MESCEVLFIIYFYFLCHCWLYWRIVAMLMCSIWDFSVQRMCVKYCKFSFLVASMSVNWKLQYVCYLLKWRENKHEKCFRCHGTVPIIIISSGEIRVKQFHIVNNDIYQKTKSNISNVEIALKSNSLTVRFFLSYSILLSKKSIKIYDLQFPLESY